MEQGRPDQALADCVRALELDTHYADTYAVRGLVFFHLGNYSQAHNDFEQALSTGEKLFLIGGEYASVYGTLENVD